MKTESTDIKAILFDLGNVLVFYDTRRASKAFSEALSVSEIEVWNAFFISDVEHAYTTGEISSREFYERVSGQFPSKLSFEVFAKIWNDIFLENEEMPELLERLEKHYPLYLISNTNDLHFEHIRKQFNVLHYFKRCFPSHEVGHRKPDPETFRHVLSQIGLEPAETVFVDDTPDFVASARSVGIQAIQFHSRKILEGELRQLGVKF